MRMSRNLKIKIAAIVAAALASIVVMGVLLSGMQGELTRANYDAEMEAEAEQLSALLAEAEDENAQNKETFDAIYQSKAQSVSFMADNDAGFEATDAKMREYQELLGVDNVLTVRADGTVVAKAADTRADFASSRFNYLRESLSTGAPSRAVEVSLPDRDWHTRYYAARIDDETMVVIEQDPAELYDLVESTGSTASVLRNIQIGQDGYVFALSAQTYVIEYHPNDGLVGADALDAGMDAGDLEDGFTGWMQLGGERLYGHVCLIDGTYYVEAVPAADMNASGDITVGVILFVFAVVAASVALYGIFVLREDEREGHGGEGRAEPSGSLRVNRRIASRAAVLSVIGFFAVIVISFYMQTLFALSSQSLTLTERVDQVASTIERSQDRAAELEDQYNERYLSKAQVAAYILDHNPGLANREKLQELADALQIQYLFTFDISGAMTATNSSFTNFTLSEDQSYEFRKLLQGVDSFVQPAGPDEVSGEMRQYIGVTTHDESGTVNGFVQLGIHPTRLETLLESVQIENVLDGVQVGVGGFAFAVNKADDTFAYYPDDNMIGKPVTECGMSETQLKDGYSDYITINGEQLYAASAETSDYYVFAASPDGALMAERGPLTAATGGIALVCLAILYCLTVCEPAAGAKGRAASAEPDEKGEGRPRMVDVTVGGRTMKTVSAASRWFRRSLEWNDMTPEQKLGCVLRWFAGAAVILVCLAVVFKDAIFERGSIFSYILGGSWQHGLNIFAVTAAIMFACLLLTVTEIIQKILMLVSRVVEARGVTMCRLASSIVKYASVIGILYWCLALLGVDTATLLASAGLLTFAVSLGAKDIVTDIISGLFIIFEGEFRVGDIIQVGGQRGTVMEIGVRTTKINDGNGNVLVLRNSNISNVVNMTKEHSYSSVEVGIEYGESLERVESILAKELPNIKRRLPAIIDGPFYKGVTMLADNSVNIKIVAECSEKDRSSLTNDLNREMKLLFDRYDISIPFPQVVVNQPTVFKKATFAEKMAADKFNSEQKEAIKNMADEDEDFDESNDSDRR